MFAKLDALLDEMLTHPLPGNDCIVCRKGEVIYRRFSGFADKEKTRPLTGNERYQIFSCSKLITCCAALQLWEKGAFQLDDPLCLYLPEYADMKVKTADGIVAARNKITIRHLFTMTAGFNYDLNAQSILQVHDATEGRCPTREVIRALAQEPLDFEPGTAWQYSLCHDVLAALVEVLSQQPFNDYVTEHILAPLGMSSVTFMLPASQFHTLVPLYREVPVDDPLCPLSGMGTHGTGPYRLGPCYASGGAGAVSTVEDFNKLLQSLCYDEKVLKRSTIEMMAVDQLTEAMYEQSWGGEYYGYGLGVRCPKRGCDVRSDFGWGGAAGAYFAIDPARELTVLYVQHVVTSSARDLRPRILEILHEILD